MSDSPLQLPGRNVSLEAVFLDYDGPQLFTVVDNSDTHYLCVHTVSSDVEDNWLVIAISNERILSISDGKYSPSKAFRNPELKRIELVTKTSDGTFKSASFRPKELPKHFFPEDFNEYREVFDFSSTHYEAGRSLQRAYEPPKEIQLGSPLWELSPAALAYFRNIRTPVAAVASHTRRHVLDLMVAPGENRIDLPAQLVGSLLTTLQKLFDSLGSERAPNGMAAKQWTRLDAVASFPSSFGLRLETHFASTVRQSSANSAFDAFLQLVSARDDLGQLKLLAERMDRRALAHYRAFNKTLMRSESSVKIEAGIPDEWSARKVELSHIQLLRIEKFFEENSSTFEDRIEFVGRLVGVSIPSKFFRMEDNDQIVSGRIADDCLPQIDNKRINAIHRAKLLSKIEVDDSSGEEKRRYTLLELHEEK